jgi:hypothetical protein
MKQRSREVNVFHMSLLDHGAERVDHATALKKRGKKQ